MPAVAEKSTPTVDDALAALEELENRIDRFECLLNGLNELATVTMEGKRAGLKEPPMRPHVAYFVSGVTDYWQELRDQLRAAYEIAYERQKGGTP